MATITLKNVPNDLHRRLKARAEQNRRSLNREAILLLETHLAGSGDGLAYGTPEAPARVAEPAVPRDTPGYIEGDEAWNRAAEFRAYLAQKGFVTSAEEIQAAIDSGRS